MIKLRLFLCALLFGALTVQAQQAEQGPYSAPLDNNGPEDLFDLLFNYDVGQTGAIGANGQAAVAFINGEFWIAAWATDQLHKLDADGSFISSFTIPGITGTRAITTDGTNVYIGTAATQIYVVNPDTQSLLSTINISAPSGATARMLTYDETLDGGNGGFWIGSFSGAIASVSMTGTELSVIPAATHGTVIYGGAVDNVSPGGPYLWIHSQSGTAPARDFITQLELPSGAPTGVEYNYFFDAPVGNSEVLAGGLFITDEYDPSVLTMIGLCQCSPSNIVFGLELVELLSANDSKVLDLVLYPNPATGVVNIQTKMPGVKEIAVFDIVGKQIINTSISGNELNISSLKSGIYFVQVSQNNNTSTKKLVVR